ncbi:hypothetical protein [Leptospira bouyouniensis]|uniref:Lipoprotein n=1 Tax=Leptospira bouyouniensis TaxID=2484911 RepID=A0ABY2LD06_9LEPT|nr:hypothetical protein [Leptospira bouyouniensis]TGK54240.1 hypothetical protein EHQ10_00300 [Leptospira bouyouniensis]
MKKILIKIVIISFYGCNNISYYIKPPLVIGNLKEIECVDQIKNVRVSSVSIEDDIYPNSLSELLSAEMNYNLNSFLQCKIKKITFKTTAEIKFKKLRFYEKRNIFYPIYVIIPLLEALPIKSTNYHYQVEALVRLDNPYREVEIKLDGIMNSHMFEINRPNEKNVFTKIRAKILENILDALYK